ncbi:3-hydroxyacyl-ACP dehydratase FabZ [Desulfosarcina variabilis]|uniref:3-hydroxyacyl-ACP dehydratase FabZ n=1 Tax=Desulfosarcina variabilis TaxID=2300 RepID=UPI003AFB39D0
MFDIKSILDHLPHRYPFLLVDRVVEFEKSKRIVALKNVTINEPFFQGHFPNMPIMPGVLIVEAMGQAGGVLVTQSLPPEKQGNLILFMGFDKVRFRKPVVPGDQLILELDMLNLRTRAVKMAGVAKVDGNVVAEAQLLAAYGD